MKERREVGVRPKHIWVRPGRTDETSTRKVGVRPKNSTMERIYG